MDCIVADSGPLIALARIDLLHLPAAIYGQALLTQTVLDECLAGGGRTDALAIAQAVAKGHFVVSLSPALPATLAVRQLDAGEASALALAMERGATVLLDELRGRRAASELAIPVVGLCGLLLLAKRQSLLPAVLPLLQRVRAAGYFLSDELLAQIRRLADE